MSQFSSISRKEKKEFKKKVRAAKHGDLDACRSVLYSYMNGIGTKQDEEKAKKFYAKYSKIASEKAERTAKPAKKKEEKAELKAKKKEEKAVFKAQKKLAKGGDASAQFFVGNCYLHGTGTGRNAIKAFRFFSSAAKQSHPEAMYECANCLHYGIGAYVNYNSAASYYAQAAAKGVPDAQMCLGGYYLLGMGGLPKDAAKGFPPVEKAYKQGNARATYYFGYCLEHGIKVSKDIKKALECYETAAKKGVPEACSELGRIYFEGTIVPKDVKTAIDYYKRAAEGGWVEAQYKYARMMEDGYKGWRDYSESAKWYKIAMENGHMEATACFGSLHDRELGVFSPSRQTAFSCFQKSAEGGCARGLDYLGSYYEREVGGSLSGREVNKEECKRKAAECYKKAADMGYPDGIAHYGHCLRIGFGVARNMALAKDYLQKAMQAGSAEAYCEWGLMLELSYDDCLAYHKNHTPHPTHVEAFSFYKKAADMGSARGQCEVARCYIERIGCQYNQEESKRMAKLSAEQGHPGGLYWKNPKLHEKAAAQRGYPEAEFRYFYTRLIDADKEYERKTYNDLTAKYCKEALFYLNSAAEHGHVEALSALANYYEGGGSEPRLLGIKQNSAKVLEYAHKLIQYGSVGGYEFLACYYFTGRFDSPNPGYGERDDKKAFEYLKIAVNGSNRPGYAENLGEMYLFGRATEKNYAEAFKYFQLSYDESVEQHEIDIGLGNAAGYWLGLCYENGYGVQRDIEQAKKYYRSALDLICGDISDIYDDMESGYSCRALEKYGWVFKVDKKNCRLIVIEK